MAKYAKQIASEKHCKFRSKCDMVEKYFLQHFWNHSFTFCFSCVW